MGRKRNVILIDSSDESPLPVKHDAKRKKLAKPNTRTIGSLFLQASNLQSSQEERSSQPQNGCLSLHTLLVQPSKGLTSHAGPPIQISAQSWLDKYGPRKEEELVVHKKKVQEVKAWLEYKLQRSAREPAVLVITGPPGSGKSCTIQALASDLGCDVIEWNAPVPNMWAEHLYSNSSDNEYMSKLAEFEMFALRAKFPTLSLTKPTQSDLALVTSTPGASQRDTSVKSTRLLLIDDLPYTSDATHRRRLIATLQNLATSARCPVVIVTTEMPSEGGGSGAGQRGGSSAGGWQKGMHKEVVAALEAVQATFMSFNPITAANIVKVLNKVADSEGLAVPQDVVKAVAEQSAGDLRNAIQSLQLTACGTEFKASARGSTARGKGRGRPTKRAKSSSDALHASGDTKNVTYMGRDQSLGLFHALGKILYNKREVDASTGLADTNKDLGFTHIQKKFCVFGAGAAGLAGGRAVAGGVMSGGGPTSYGVPSWDAGLGAAGKVRMLKFGNGRSSIVGGVGSPAAQNPAPAVGASGAGTAMQQAVVSNSVSMGVCNTVPTGVPNSVLVGTRNPEYVGASKSLPAGALNSVVSSSNIGAAQVDDIEVINLTSSDSDPLHADAPHHRLNDTGTSEWASSSNIAQGGFRQAYVDMGPSQNASTSRHVAAGSFSQWIGDAPIGLNTERHINRPPLTQDPEQILQRSGLDAAAITHFLHENYLEFVTDDAMDDVASCSAYLSDAGFMSCYRNSGMASCSYWGDDEGGAASLVDAAAGSVAARGLLWGNASSAQRRWLPLRASYSLKVAQARVGNLASIQQALLGTKQWGLDRLSGALSPTCASGSFAAEVLPVMRGLSRWESCAWIRGHLPASWLLVKQGRLVQQEIQVEQGGGMGDEDAASDGPGEEIEDSDNDG